MGRKATCGLERAISRIEEMEIETSTAAIDASAKATAAVAAYTDDALDLFAAAETAHAQGVAYRLVLAILRAERDADLRAAEAVAA